MRVLKNRRGQNVPWLLVKVFLILLVAGVVMFVFFDLQGNVEKFNNCGSRFWNILANTVKEQVGFSIC